MKNIIKFGFLTVAIFGIIFLLIGCEVPNYYDDPDAIKNKNDLSIFVGSKSTNVGNIYTHTANNFRGMKTIKTLKIDGNLSLNIELEITSGRFKLLLVNESNIITVCEGNTRENIILNNIENGSYKLKMVGDEAKFDLKINF
jgi:hypothetical protein